MTEGNCAAFPVTETMFLHNQGLTKRELIAAMCLQALLTAHYSVEPHPYAAQGNPDQIAEVAIQHADALLEAV